MSLSLRERWQRRLDEAQGDPSWQTRVYRFLLARYGGQEEEAPLAVFPLYEGDLVAGRANLLLSPQEQGKRLSHIARGNLERMEADAPVSNDFFESGAWKELQRRRKREVFQQFGQKPPPFPQAQYYLPRWLDWLYFDIGRWGLGLLNQMLPPQRRMLFAKVELRWRKAAVGLKFLHGIICSRH